MADDSTPAAAATPTSRSRGCTTRRACRRWPTAGHARRFLRRMLAQLPRDSIEAAPNVRATARQAAPRAARDDPAIALLDAWAVVADVLTFYQERIANEGFLRTATERRSILELAAPDRLRAQPGRRRRASSWRSGRRRRRCADARSSSRRARACRACRARASCRRPSRPATRSRARASGTRCSPGRCGRRSSRISDGKLILLGQRRTGCGRRCRRRVSTCIRSISICPCLPGDGRGHRGGHDLRRRDADAPQDRRRPAPRRQEERRRMRRNRRCPRVVRAIEEEDALDRTRVEFEGPQLKPPATRFRLNQVAAASLAVASALNARPVANAVAAPPSASRRSVRSAPCRGGMRVARQLLLPCLHTDRAEGRSCRRRRLERSRCGRGSDSSGTTRPPWILPAPATLRHCEPGSRRTT